MPVFNKNHGTVGHKAVATVDRHIVQFPLFHLHLHVHVRGNPQHETIILLNLQTWYLAQTD